MQYDVSNAWAASFSPKQLSSSKENQDQLNWKLRHKAPHVWAAAQHVSGHEKVVRYIFYILSRLLEQTSIREGAADRS